LNQILVHIQTYKRTRLADAVTVDPISGQEYFAMPYEKKMPFGKFLDIMLGEKTDYPHYASLQNSSLTTEYVALIEDVDTDIPWFSEAVGQYRISDSSEDGKSLLKLMLDY
jgi:hypothetical protein